MKTNTYIFVVVLALLGCTAQEDFAQGDAEQGSVLGYSCLGCHGIEGYRNAYPSYKDGVFTPDVED